MLFNRSKPDARRQDHAPKQNIVPYKLASYEHDHEGKKFKSSKVVFSFWSAAKYVLILSLMLWWLPMFGQMIAGYVGGRRAGSPWKGVAAAILPVVCLYAVVTGFDSGLLPSHLFGFAVAPAAVGASLNHNIPLISPYLDFSSQYVGAFVSGLAGSSPYGINTYVLTVAFAYVGGVLAEQNRREIEYSAGAVTSTTTVLVHNPHANHPAEMAAQEQPAGATGVIAGISGLLHRGSREQPTGAMHALHRHKDPWAYAADMRYGNDRPVYDEGYALPSADEMQMRGDYEYGGYQSRPRRHSSRDEWGHKQRRRGRPNYSAKPRFRYQQYEDRPVQKNNYNYSGGWSKHQRSGQNNSVSTDPRSIRRTRKLIDSEWNGRRHEGSYPRQGSESMAAVDEEPVAEHPHRKEHVPSHNWDSI